MAVEMIAFFGGNAEIVMQLDMYAFTETYKSMTRIRRRQLFAAAPILQVAAQGNGDNLKEMVRRVDDDPDERVKSDRGSFLSKFAGKKV